MKIQRNLVITTPFAPPPLSLSPIPTRLKKNLQGLEVWNLGKSGVVFLLNFLAGPVYQE